MDRGWKYLIITIVGIGTNLCILITGLQGDP
jgi:hypothetical protein